MSNFKKPKMIRIQNSLSIDMILIKKGIFTMGEGSDIKEVEIKEDFELGKYTVTIAEYMHFAKEHKEHLPKWLKEGDTYNIHTGSDDYYKTMNLTDNAPIIGVNWDDGVAFCAWLSQKTNDNYRLPREAEWEYACRAGSTTKWSFGDDEKELDKYAWYQKNSDSKTHLVGEKEPTKWGLYDMHGNVWEWCEDWYDEDKKRKILRGGSWVNFVHFTRSAHRNWFYPSYSNYVVGFRLLRTLS